MEIYMVMDVLNSVNLSQNSYILVIQNSLPVIAVPWKTIKPPVFKEKEDFFSNISFIQKQLVSQEVCLLQVSCHFRMQYPF